MTVRLSAQAIRDAFAAEGIQVRPQQLAYLSPYGVEIADALSRSDRGALMGLAARAVNAVLARVGFGLRLSPNTLRAIAAGGWEQIDTAATGSPTGLEALRSRVISVQGGTHLVDELPPPSECPAAAVAAVLESVTSRPSGNDVAAPVRKAAPSAAAATTPPPSSGVLRCRSMARPYDLDAVSPPPRRRDASDIRTVPPRDSSRARAPGAFLGMQVAPKPDSPIPARPVRIRPGLANPMRHGAG